MRSKRPALHDARTALSVGVATFFLALAAGPVAAQQTTLTPEQKAMVDKRNDIERQLEDVAIIDRKVMVKMRDGKRMAADVYRPKNAGGKVPTIFVRTPYNFNFWDVKLGAPRDMSRQLAAVKRGYAYVDMNERGHFFSEGNYEILGAPLSDGVDAVRWMTSQPWSNGKVGTTGCSSTAEWQMAVVAENEPGLATFNVQGFGAGVGKVGPYYEQGNWYRGGAVQMLFISWLYGEQNQVRPMFPPGTSQADLIRASKAFDLAAAMPPVDWDKAFWTLPEKDIMKAIDGPKGIFADAMDVPTGGNMIARTPNSPNWYKGGLWHENMKIDKPGLWFMSWFDVSVSPNLAAYNHVRETASKAVADQQYAVIAPVLHCAFTRATEHTMIGDLDVGDARFDYEGLVFGWFDKFLKGVDSPVVDKQPKVMYYVMGENKWRNSPTWPPVGAITRELYFTSGGKANTLYGDGKLAEKPADTDQPDSFLYDPANPVTTLGGGGCCQGTAVKFGSFDQNPQLTRNDILVYDSEPFKEGTEVSGPITVTLYVSSDAKDTDFTFKVMDVYPDGKAYNITENIQRMRYRDGYGKPPVWMKDGETYKVTFQPIDTSNFFAAGHKLRVAVTSSNFPRFDRNLNTGGNNYDEAKGVVAHNVVHHDAAHPSKIVYTVVPRNTP
ncbi:CocE/NonD family hydrolase [Luteibacter sp. 3190]|uniref:CocE/NonD family hydrolase n=1 Tax=Luteibacter sp. 3190 TaxID=2817736 RepID=UPI00285B46E5|nr:CocE/NonD family hydrolase [Luteibacter sp. 3190]MDR6935296.1 putative CocE/NonD family hydrolase [Luteibacter sp. 3190]